ncbi:hypothetical protein, partial [Heyndrickxia coagulans]|uniref:hypothetical protein n=1 Tax=Heyndrickxia coagulans TaxID=1398 RepID=UPI00214DB8DE
GVASSINAKVFPTQNALFALGDVVYSLQNVGLAHTLFNEKVVLSMENVVFSMIINCGFFQLKMWHLSIDGQIKF